MLYGDNTFLDRYGTKKARLSGIEAEAVQHAELSAPFRRDDHLVWDAGSHVIECIIPEVLARHFSFFFHAVTGIEGFDPQLFSDVFRMKAVCSVSIRRAEREAEEWRERIDEVLRRAKKGVC